MILYIKLAIMVVLFAGSYYYFNVHAPLLTNEAFVAQAENTNEALIVYNKQIMIYQFRMVYPAVLSLLLIIPEIKQKLNKK